MKLNAPRLHISGVCARVNALPDDVTELCALLGGHQPNAKALESSTPVTQEARWLNVVAMPCREHAGNAADGGM